MKKNRLLSMVLAVALTVGALAACTPSGQQPPAQQGTPTQSEPVQQPAATYEPPTPPVAAGPSGSLIIATANETPSVAPARHNAAAGSFKNLMTHSGLFRVDPVTIEPVEHLVAGWSPLSDTLFEFTLHEGIMFHNGEELTAEDVVASMYYVRTHPYSRGAHGSVVEATVVDRYTFTLDTGVPNAALFFDLTHQGNSIMPKSLIEAGHDFTVSPIGSGPFVFQDWRLGDSLTFTAFDNYFIPERAARVEEVVWRIIPEGSSRTIALETGEVDFVVEVAFPDVPRLQEHPDVYVSMTPGTAQNFILLNNDAPQFSNIYARRAIDMAIDRDALVMAAFNGFATPTMAQVPIVFAGSSTEGMNSFDPEAARALLAEHSIDPASLAFEVIASNEERRRMGEVVQANLADIGITVSIVQMDDASTQAVLIDGNYEAGFGQWAATNIFSFVRNVLHQGGEMPNRSRIRNQELSDLIDMGVATIDATERVAIFEEASRIANYHTGNIPTHLAMVIRAFNVNIVAPELAPTGALNLNMIYWAQ